MSHKRLVELGAFAQTPTKRKIEWTKDDGEVVSFDCWIKGMPFGEAEKLWKVDPDSPDRSVSAMIISRQVCFDEKGADMLTYEDAFQLRPSFAYALMQSVSEVNGNGKKSQPPTNSGMSSSLPESAAEASPKPKQP
ncbi:MAG: phage tail assembly chaperone family protein, TAC [Gallionella sp.]|jgi:hypothetical protein